MLPKPNVRFSATRLRSGPTANHQERSSERASAAGGKGDEFASVLAGEPGGTERAVVAGIQRLEFGLAAFLGFKAASSVPAEAPGHPPPGGRSAAHA